MASHTALLAAEHSTGSSVTSWYPSDGLTLLLQRPSLLGLASSKTKVSLNQTEGAYCCKYYPHRPDCPWFSTPKRYLQSDTRNRSHRRSNLSSGCRFTDTHLRTT